MAKICALVFVGVVLTIANAASLYESTDEDHWINFKTTHKKNYPTENEDKYRFGLFSENLKRVEDHNAKRAEGSFSLEVNHLADMTQKELGRLNGFNMTMHREFRERRTLMNLNTVFTTTKGIKEIPESMDWRKRGAVTRVKDQGRCGSCWAFSATGALEGQESLKQQSLLELSEQNLIDCSKTFGNNGCNGGIMDKAFEYVQMNNGLDSEGSYPYKGVDTEICQYKTENSAMTDNGFVDIPEGDEEKLKIAVATVGPISVAIDASSFSFKSYSKGIYYNADCSSQDLDHGVLVVGYGTEFGKDYWLVKNSWSETWGDAGYIKMARNRNNNCGIASAASFPKVEEVEPKQTPDNIDRMNDDSGDDSLEARIIPSGQTLKLKRIIQERIIYEYAKKR